MTSRKLQYADLSSDARVRVRQTRIYKLATVLFRLIPLTAEVSLELRLRVLHADGQGQGQDKKDSTGHVAD